MNTHKTTINYFENGKKEGERDINAGSAERGETPPPPRD